MSVGILCDRVWKGYYVTNRKRGTKLHEEKSIQGSIALHIANLCRILIFRNVLWISDAEHGISMLDKYQNVGWKKFYLIYGMCDETFSVNCTTEVPEGVDKGWFMFFVTLLNQIYWVIYLRRHVVHKKTRRCLTAIGCLMVFWFFVRTVKFHIFHDPLGEHICWYLYYIPMILIPVLGLAAAMFWAKRRKRKRSERL